MMVMIGDMRVGDLLDSNEKNEEKEKDEVFAKLKLPGQGKRTNTCKYMIGAARNRQWD